MKTDEQLWDDFQAGDQSALADLMARYQGPASRYVAGHGVTPPDDVVQQAFIEFATIGPRDGRYFKPVLYSLIFDLVKEQQAADRREARRLASPELEVLAEAFQR